MSVADSVALRAWTEPIVPRSTVGAGDAALAGFLSAWGEPGIALRTAVAWGAAAVKQPGTGMPGPADIHVEGVTVERVDLDTTDRYQKRNAVAASDGLPDSTSAIPAKETTDA